MQRMYDVCRVTRGGVTWTAINVSRDEALLNMAVVLAAYGNNWQLQPENPRGCVRVLNTCTSEYHIVIVLETELSSSHEAERVIEREQFSWLFRADEVDSFHVGDTEDYTVDVDQTPTEGLIVDLLREGSDAVEESEVAYVYQI